MHLVADAALTGGDLEGTLVTPGVVPGVDAEPVWQARRFVSSPTDALNGVTTESRARSVNVDSRLVGEEVLIDGEGGSDSTVSGNVLLDIIDAVETVAAAGLVLVISINAAGIIRASLSALRLNLSDIITKREGIAVDVMGTLLHGVVEASSSATVVTSSDDTSSVEPAPWGADLTTVAAEGEALRSIAAGSGVSNGEESLVCTTRADAETIVESLSGTVSPAGTTVGLVTDVVDNRFAISPLSTGIEVSREAIVHEHWGVTNWHLDSPVPINNSAHKASNFIEGNVGEFGILTGNPSGFRVGVHSLNVLGKIKRGFTSDNLENIEFFTELDVLAGLFGTREVDQILTITELILELLELGELIVKLVKLSVVSLGDILDAGLAELADEVALSEELVDFASVGDSSNSCNCVGAHCLVFCKEFNIIKPSYYATIYIGLYLIRIFMIYFLFTIQK